MSNRKGKKKYGQIISIWRHKNSHITKAMHRLTNVIKAHPLSAWRTLDYMYRSDVKHMLLSYKR